VKPYQLLRSFTAARYSERSQCLRFPGLMGGVEISLELDAATSNTVLRRNTLPVLDVERRDW
jgi:hypothetical protein